MNDGNPTLALESCTYNDENPTASIEGGESQSLVSNPADNVLSTC